MFITLFSKVCKGTFVLTKLVKYFLNNCLYNQARSFALHPCKEINIIIVLIILYIDNGKIFFFD
jgi:hypothetical protein